jgi:hypothetical protein
MSGVVSDREGRLVFEAILAQCDAASQLLQPQMRRDPRVPGGFVIYWWEGPECWPERFPYGGETEFGQVVQPVTVPRTVKIRPLGTIGVIVERAVL